MDGTRWTRSDRNGRKRAGRGRPCRGPIAAQAEGGHLSNGQSARSILDMKALALEGR